jgi:hypothetical protein
MSPEHFVVNADKLVSVYGRWPSFHDAEIETVIMDRRGPFIQIRLEAHERTDELTEEGVYRRLKRCVITFRFTDVENLALDDFNHQNVIAEMVMHRGEKVKVEIQGIFGMSAQFQCSDVIVDDVDCTG